ncbi:Serine/threonine-protein kinase PBS1 [Capsicum chinense]|nr:Serine/threonine-protein kinase PBS1 [Capsicum chinense]
MFRFDKRDCSSGKHPSSSPLMLKDGGYSRAPPSDGKTGVATIQRFKFDQLVTATENFKEDYFLGEEGFGRVYKGRMGDTSEIVANKKLDPNGCQGVKEFVVEVQTLSKADHPNIVKLIGYYAWPSQKPLDWNIRIKIAAGAVIGLEYLHDKITPPIIYWDLKCFNILLGEEYHPKLSNFGLAKVDPSGGQDLCFHRSDGNIWILCTRLCYDWPTNI